jgi:hypothetical protein
MELLVSERVDLSKKTETFIQILIKECQKSGEDFNKEYPRIKTDLKKYTKREMRLPISLH